MPKKLFCLLILTSVLSSCDAVLMLGYVVQNKTKDTLNVHAPANKDFYSVNVKDSVYQLAPNQSLVVGWNRGIGFPWETRKLYQENPSIWNFEIEQDGKPFPIIKNNKDWIYRKGVAIYKIKPLK